MIQTIKPKRLKIGDTIGLIAPASAVKDSARIARSTEYLIDKGFKVELGGNVGKVHGYLAGRDEERLADIHYMFGNKEIDAVFCLRGGYGSGRLLDKLDFDLIKNNPKIFVGYSDITTLQAGILQKTGLTTFAGPMPAVDFHGDTSEYAMEWFFNILMKGYAGEVDYPKDWKVGGNKKGIAKGRLIGGNCALLCAIAGSPYFPETEGNILVIEDTDEPPYRIDRMLNQLKLAGVFNKISGLVVGQFSDCESNNSYSPSLTFEDVMADYIYNLDVPVLYNFPHGHIKELATMAFGTKVEIDSNDNRFTYSEPSVI